MSRTIATILTLRDNMSGGIVRATRNVSGMSREMQRATRQSTNATNKIGKNIMKMTDKIVKATAKFAAFGAIAGVGVVFKVGIEGLKELDEAAAKVKSIALRDLEKKDIKTNLLKSSNKTGVGVSELANTQYDAISSGVSSKDSLGASLVSAKLAKAGFTDSNSALKVLMSTMNVYGQTGNKSMQLIADKMMVVQNLGVITVAEMAESMGSVTPIAQAAGASVDELDAGMIALTKNGIKADEASVELKGIFTSIISPTAESAKMAKSLGLEFNAAALKSKGFSKFMADVKEKTGGSTEKIAGLFGNVRALTGALVLSGVGAKDFNNGLLALKNSSGTTDEAFNIMQNTIGAKWDKLKNRFKNACTSIVDTQSGALGKVSDGLIKWLDDNQGNIEKWTDNIGKTIQNIYGYIKQLVDFVKEHKTAIENFAIVFASFYIAAKAVLALKVAFSALRTMIVITEGAMALSGVGIAIIVIGTLIAAGVLLWRNWDTVKEKADAFGFAIKNVFSNVGTFVGNIFKGMANDFIDNINKMIDLLNKLPGVKINAIKKYDMGEYASLTRPKGTSASRSYDALAQRKQTTSTSAKIKQAHSIPQHALGTQYSYGGLSIVGERGPEIVNLGKGDTVTTADKTSKILGGKGGHTFIINFNGNVGDDEFFDRAGNRIVGKIKDALSNM